MKTYNLSFPHPVLGMGDDVLPLPSISARPLIKKASQYTFEFDIDMRNSDIHRLIKKGYAEYVCEIECPRTLLRKCVFATEPHFKFSIEKNHLAERVSFQLSVVVREPIKGYINQQWHEDYMGFSFDLEPGDLLAFFGELTYDVDIKYDKLKSVGSFMQITEGKTDKMPRYVLGGEKIEIKLPSELYSKYKSSIKGNKQFAHIIHSSLVYNALTTALLYFEENKNTLWARTLQYRIDTEQALEKFKESDTLTNQDPGEIMELAQILLMDPYKRLFESLENLIKPEEEE